MKKDGAKLSYRNFIFLLIASFINAVAVTLFLTPLKILDGGFSGTSQLLANIFSEFPKLKFITLSLLLVLLNFPFFIIGYKKLGFHFVIYSLFAITGYSIFAYLFQHILKIDFSNGSPFTKNDILLSSIFGGILSGIGSGMTIRYGGALDGVEVMSILFSKKLTITVGTFVMIYNIIIFIFAGIYFNSYINPLYSIIAYFANLKTIDFIVEGLDKSKAVIIITTKAEELSTELSNQFGKGITLVDANGFYSKEDKTAIYFVINRFQINKLKSSILKIDQDAFVTISEVSEVLKRK